MRGAGVVRRCVSKSPELVTMGSAVWAWRKGVEVAAMVVVGLALGRGGDWSAFLVYNLDREGDPSSSSISKNSSKSAVGSGGGTNSCSADGGERSSSNSEDVVSGLPGGGRAEAR